MVAIGKGTEGGGIQHDAERLFAVTNARKADGKRRTGDETPRWILDLQPNGNISRSCPVGANEDAFNGPRAFQITRSGGHRQIVFERYIHSGSNHQFLARFLVHLRGFFDDVLRIRCHMNGVCAAVWSLNGRVHPSRGPRHKRGRVKQNIGLSRHLKK